MNRQRQQQNQQIHQVTRQKQLCWIRYKRKLISCCPCPTSSRTRTSQLALVKLT